MTKNQNNVHFLGLSNSTFESLYEIVQKKPINQEPYYHTGEMTK